MKTAGIYKIQRIGTEQCYVGSSSYIKHRWTDHRRSLMSGCHHSVRLQRAWLKHGEAAFEFLVVEECQGSGEVLKLVLVEREQAWMDQLCPCFNTVPAAASTLGYKHTPASLQKMVGRYVGPETREKISKAKTGVKRPAEAVEASASAKRGKPRPRHLVELTAQANTGRKNSPKAIERMRAVKLGKRHSAESIAKMMGRVDSPEVVERKRAAALRPEVLERNRLAHLGKTHSPETREKMRISAIAARARRRDVASL